MEFKYKEDVKELECVAYMTHMKGETGRKCLVIKGDDGYTVWLYYDGAVRTFNRSYNPWEPEKATKKFYKGDEVTIKF